jgi:DNA-binding CsgD family transcriptional regulator
MPRSIGPAAEAVLSSRGNAQQLKRIFERNPIPMVIVDDRRRYVDVNVPARLALRGSLDEMRSRRVDDLTPAHALPMMEAAWARLLVTGSVAGRFDVGRADGSRLDVLYWGLANALSGLHLVAFAPAGWPDHDLRFLEADNGDRPFAPLTPRERQVLQLAAEGASGPNIAERLFVSPGTVKTHFRNIYEKLGARDRAAAVARGLRLGFID